MAVKFESSFPSKPTRSLYPVWEVLERCQYSSEKKMEQNGAGGGGVPCARPATTAPRWRGGCWRGPSAAAAASEASDQAGGLDRPAAATAPANLRRLSAAAGRNRRPTTSRAAATGTGRRCASAGCPIWSNSPSKSDVKLSSFRLVSFAVFLRFLSPSVGFLRNASTTPWFLSNLPQSHLTSFASMAARSDGPMDFDPRW